MPTTYYYTRQSKDVDTQRNSSAYQKDECERYHARNKEDMPKLYEETFSDVSTSGYKVMFADRERGGRLFNLLKKGDHVVVHHVDRVGRNMFDIVSVLGELDKKGVTVHIVDMLGAPLQMDSMVGKIVLMALAMAAELESQRVSSRTRLALRRLREQGRAFCGKPSYGYRAVDGFLKEDAHEQARIIIMKRLYKAGHSPRAIARYAKEKGWKTRLGAYVDHLCVNRIVTGYLRPKQRQRCLEDGRPFRPVNPAGNDRKPRRKSENRPDPLI